MEGYLELGCVDRDLADRQNVTSNRDRHEKVLRRGHQSNFLCASDLGVRYDSINDKTPTGGYVLRDVWLVDRCTTKREERGVGRGRDWELTTWGNDWGSFLVVLIAPRPRRERDNTGYTICDVRSPFLLPQRRAG